MRLDRLSVQQLFACGIEGGRWFCVFGCRDVWIRLRRLRGEPVAAVERRGRYQRPWRTIECQHCHRPVKTRGNNTQMCPPCRRTVMREKERARLRRRRLAAGG